MSFLLKPESLLNTFSNKKTAHPKLYVQDEQLNVRGTTRITDYQSLIGLKPASYRGANGSPTNIHVRIAAGKVLFTSIHSAGFSLSPAH
jgi:hypothetical protein